MKFNPPLNEAVLIKRYKRFLADVELEDGSEMTLHCPNTGSMKNCQNPGSRIWYSTSNNPKRKYPSTWEIVAVSKGSLAGINTSRSNTLVKEAIVNGLIKPLQNYQLIRSEVPYGKEKSRIDFLLENDDGEDKCFVEVKNVTLGNENEEGICSGLGLFPDAVTERGRKHLRELIEIKKKHRAVLIFCVQHTGINEVQPADTIDPEYGRALRLAISAGVEVYAYKASISDRGISLTEEIPVSCP